MCRCSNFSQYANDLHNLKYEKNMRNFKPKWSATGRACNAVLRAVCRVSCSLSPVTGRTALRAPFPFFDLLPEAS